MRFVLAAAVAALVVSASANAAIETRHFVGSFAKDAGNATTSLAGKAFSGSFSYDTSVEQQQSWDGLFGIIVPAMTQIRFSTSDFSVAWDFTAAPINIDILRNEDTGLIQYFGVRSYSALPVFGVTIPGPARAGLNAWTGTGHADRGMAYDGVHLPLNGDFSSYDQSSFEFFLESNGERLYDAVGSFQVTADPEPVTWAMMIVGFGVIGAMSRRRAARSGLMQPNPQ